MDMKTQRFKSLDYNAGPVFPAEYEPKGYSVNGEKLTAIAEEMLFSAARYFEHEEYWPKLIKTGNFWNCLKSVLSANHKKLSFPQDFEKCIKQMKGDQENAKAAKKELTKEEKASAKLEREALKAKHGFVELDGKPAEIGGYMIEAPSIIITRGKDPRFGNWKWRVKPEDVTLNIVGGKGPKNWKGKIASDATAIWVIGYSIECGVQKTKTYKKLNKRICFAGSTNVWQEARVGKFDKTADILKNWKKIQAHILSGINSKDKKTQESAIIAYLIQMTGIRVGGERDLNLVADTKGASTLLKDNIELL